MRAAALVLALLAAPTVGAQLAVPPLTGRVVDLADVVSPSSEAAITARLAAHEDSTSNQIAVLTVPSLQGVILEQYATEVFRAWGLGQEDRDNGVLLLVAVADRKLRIEVGYGLEGALTDATAAAIIRNDITPRFRAGDFDAGILAGTDAILSAIDGEYVASDGDDIGDMGWGERLIVGFLMVLIPLFATITSIAVTGATGLKGDLLAGFVGSVGAVFVGSGIFILTLSGLALTAIAIPFVLIVLNRWLERHPTWGPKRRHNRAKQAAFAKARKRGATSVVVDGRSYSVPVASSSSSGGGGFSGGGGSSGGGGASGGW